MKLYLLLPICLLGVLLSLATTPQVNAKPATDTQEEENASEEPPLPPLPPFPPSPPISSPGFGPLRPFPRFTPFPIGSFNLTGNFTGRPLRPFPLPFLFPTRNFTGRTLLGS
ncbi:anthrax toxin receptor-like [Anastrepha ludens]|uniref:anthrax toxin receptor-like n=1 Tax=Anastrepha ludens TaxID=28586 RepID=UPI0023AF25A9|nr:anthrax toxin receptor-like [Anastrepha ludens]